MRSAGLWRREPNSGFKSTIFLTWLVALSRSATCAGELLLSQRQTKYRPRLSDENEERYSGRSVLKMSFGRTSLPDTAYNRGDRPSPVRSVKYSVVPFGLHQHWSM